LVPASLGGWAVGASWRRANASEQIACEIRLYIDRAMLTHIGQIAAAIDASERSLDGQRVARRSSAIDSLQRSTVDMSE
jgi:hypothetical protein